MEPCRTVTVDLPESMIAALGRAAALAGVGPSDYLRAVLRGALDRTPARLRSREEEISRARHLSSGWVGLQIRLRALGCVLRRGSDGDLVLMSWPIERPLMHAAQVGLGLAALTLQFGTGFPAEADRKPARLPATAAPGRAERGRAA
ncbi:MAG: hypothetical protein KDE00_12225 [Rhodobacteraceae bacterium]|nr:hypothetical protein [Paracoccaceae bacterium]